MKSGLLGVFSTIAAVAIAVPVAMSFASIVPQPVLGAAGRQHQPPSGAFCRRHKLPGVQTPYGQVTISELGPVQNMRVEVFNLPGKAEFAPFVIRVPNKPFGLSWYHGNVETNSSGHGVADVTGIFSNGTFTFAPPEEFPDDNQ